MQPKRSIISLCRTSHVEPCRLRFLSSCYSRSAVKARYVIWQTEPQRGLNKDANDANDFQRQSLWGKNRICKHASIRLPLSHRSDYSRSRYFVTTARRLSSKRSDVGFCREFMGNRKLCESCGGKIISRVGIVCTNKSRNKFHIV